MSRQTRKSGARGDRTNLYSEITDKIIAELEAGRVPWVQPWGTAAAKAGVSIEELAEDIARRGLLQSLNVRPVLDADGTETGVFEIPAGGRRYRALELLVKAKRLNKTAPVPCVVRETGTEISAEEDSLAENAHRAALHPLDQFRAFRTLRDQGLTEEEIAARFFVSTAIVKQRLKLVTVSETLLDAYAEDEMTLDQLMAFTVSSDHARQKQVWESIQHSWSKEPYQIRRMLTENTVRASDRRVRFVTIEVYEEAGGIVLRDLFQDDDGGWIEDVPLLEQLVADKLKAEAEAIAGEGWKWIEVAADFPYGHTQGLRSITGTPVDLTEDERARREALRNELDDLEAEYAEADELPDEVDARLQGLRHRAFGAGIERARRLVQQQDRRVAQNGAGQRQALLLAAREPEASLADQGVIALGQGRDMVMDLRHLRGRDHIGPGRLGADKAQVLGHRGIEQIGLLRHDPQHLRQRRKAEIAQIHPVEADRASVDIVKPRQKVAERGLARARRPDDGDMAARRDGQGHIIDRPKGLARIGKADMVQLHRAAHVGPGDGHRIGALGDLDRLVEIFEDPGKEGRCARSERSEARRSRPRPAPPRSCRPPARPAAKDPVAARRCR